MDNLAENIFYKRAKKIRPKMYVFLLAFFLIYFIGQLVFIYLFYIPKILVRYNEFPTIQNQVQLALEKVASIYMIWPVLFFVLLGIMVYYVNNIQKLLKSIENN